MFLYQYAQNELMNQSNFDLLEIVFNESECI